MSKKSIEDTTLTTKDIKNFSKTQAVDWVKERIERDVYRALMKAGKIPSTEKGREKIIKICNKTIRDGIRLGILRVDDSTTPKVSSVSVGKNGEINFELSFSDPNDPLLKELLRQKAIEAKISKAILQEREECAKVADTFIFNDFDDNDIEIEWQNETAKKIVKAIRERGKG